MFALKSDDIFNRFFDPIIGSLISNRINFVFLGLIEQIFFDTFVPNIGSVTLK
jgi:hypothetical protein